MKRILTLLCLCLTLAVMMAAPARRGRFTHTQANGTVLTLQLVGDEHMHYFLNINTNEKMYRGEDGDFYTLSDEALELRSQAAQQRRAIISAARQQRLNKHKAASANGARRVGSVSGGMTGNKKGLVILVNFSDKSMASGHTQSAFNNQFNQEGYTTGGHLGSVHDYFYDQSYGQFNLTFDVVGPVTVSKTMSYYGSNDSNGDDKYPATMVIEALKLVDSQVNFSDYDWDGDGEVDQVYVIYAGYGEAYGASSSTIWPHEWQLSSAKQYGDGSGAQTLDGVKIDTYACSCELSGTSGSTLNGIGTACHEFSHCLGFPDFYDTSYAGGFGMNAWDLMDAGSYNGPSGYGEVPCGYTSYERMCAGWLSPTELSSAATISQMKSLHESPEAYVIYNDKNEDEFILLENRQNTKWFKYVDTYTTPHGLLAIHVDYDASAWTNNTPNNTASHQRMSIIPASGTYGSKTTSSGQTYYTCTETQLKGHPFSGSGSKTSLTGSSNSSSGGKWFTSCSTGSTTLNHEVTEISNASDGTISFLFDGGAIVDDGSRYTLTLNPGTGTCGTSTWTQSSFQETFTLPTCTSPNDDWTFIGWSTVFIEEGTTKPTALYAAGSTYQPTADATLYAVYKKQTSGSGTSGSYTLDYTAETALQALSLGYGTKQEYTATDGSKWVVKAYKNKGMQINAKKDASIKVPECPSAITSIVVTDATARVLKFSATDYTGSNTPTAAATSESSKNATLDLSSSNLTTGYIYTIEGSTVITKVVVNYGGGTSYLYATNPGGTALVTPTIAFEKSAYSLLMGGKSEEDGSVAVHTATVSGVDNPTVTYTSSDETVATVGPNTGRVVAKGLGTTTITATVAAVDGVSREASATYKLTVSMPELSSIAVTTQPTTTTYMEDAKLSADGLVVTATYANGYTAAVTGYTLSPAAGEALTLGTTAVTVSYTEGEVTKTTTFPITVTEKPKYTVTFNAGSGTCSSEELSEPSYQGGVVLPSAEGVNEEWVFAGWATEAVSATNTRPTLYAAGSTYKPTSNVTLYAVYSLSETTGGSGNYELVSEALTDWSGDYLIAYSSTIFADGRVGGTSGIGKAQSHVNPGDKLKETTVEAEWGDTYHVSLESVTGGYVMKTQDGLYNYRTSNTNGIDSSNDLATATDNAIKITFNSKSDIDLACGSAVFHYNTAVGSTGEMFRFYKNGEQSNIYLYKKQGSLVNVTYNSNPTGAVLVVPEIAFAKAEKSILVGDTCTNMAICKNSTGNISYASSDTKVATVEPSTGIVTAVGVGTAIITAYVDAVPGVSKAGSTTYTLNVTMPALSAIEIASAATSTTYDEGDALSLAGLSLTATYANGYKQTISDGFTTSPAAGEALAAGTQTVVVSYTEGEVTKTTSYEITVNELPKYAVTFTVNGRTTVVAQQVANTGVEAPQVADYTTTIDGEEVTYTFAGWTTTDVAEETTSKPTLLKLTDGKYTPTQDTQLYAVYQRTAGNFAKGFTLSLTYNDVVYYVGAANNTSSRFDSSTDSEKASTLFYSDGYLWTKNSSGEAYYVYSTNASKADLGFNTTKSTDYKWTMSESEGVVSFTSQTTSKVLALNENSTGIIRAYGTGYPHEWNLTYNDETFSVGSTNFYTGYPKGRALVGDVNKDGVVNLADVTALVSILLGEDSEEPYTLDHEAADVDGNGGITKADAEALIRLLLEQAE